MRIALSRLVLSLAVVCAFAMNVDAQVTTGSLGGKVQNEKQEGVQGASVIAIHLPSGTTYETTSRADGRFVILNMRVGGPYKVTAELIGFGVSSKTGVEVTLGNATDLSFTLSVATLAEQVTVVATPDPTFGSQRTGAATSVSRKEIALLPTISGRINDIARLTPQCRRP